MISLIALLLACGAPDGGTAADPATTPDGTDPVTLPPEPLVSPVIALGLFDQGSTELFTGGYTEFTAYLVGGAIESPYLLADYDGDGSDADEHWRLNRLAGERLDSLRFSAKGNGQNQKNR